MPNPATIPMRLRLLPLLFPLLLVTTAAAAQAPEPATVIVPGTKIAIGWRYEVFAAGMETFDDGRAALAPRAGLRFRLLLSPGVAALDNVALTLVDGDRLAPVAMSADGYFTLPRDGVSDAAELAANRNGGQYDAARTPQPEVRSPGLPEHVRRLGDLRLECRVRMAMAKEVLGFMASAAIGAIGGFDWCAPRKRQATAVAMARPVAAATLAEGNRSMALAAKGNSVSVPIADGTWSNEALVTLAWANGDEALQAPQ